LSTQAAVRAAWASAIWADSSITAYSAKIYDFDIESIATVSAAHNAKTLVEGKVNFWQYTISRAWAYENTGKKECRYLVTVRYYRDAQEDLSGTGFNAVHAAFDTLIPLVLSALTMNWGGTIEAYELQDGPPAIAPILIQERPVWRGEYQFRGYKQI
jgi:hypothetical protein